MRERLGSGGPRGLQILRSGVKSVRGGFDSHAFPPIVWGLGLVLALALAAAGAVAGAEGALGYNMLQDLDELDRLNAQVMAARAANDAEAELVAVVAYNDRQAALVG